MEDIYYVFSLSLTYYTLESYLMYRQIKNAKRYVCIGLPHTKRVTRLVNCTYRVCDSFSLVLEVLVGLSLEVLEESATEEGALASSSR